MAKFSTPYDTLLRVRRIEEDKAKAALASANAGQREAAARLEASREAYVHAARAPHGETDLAAFTAHRRHAQAAAGAVGLARTEVEKAEEAKADAVDVVRQASMRTQGLERLVERAKQQRMDEMLAADQRTAEESMAGKKRKAGQGGS